MIQSGNRVAVLDVAVPLPIYRTFSYVLPEDTAFEPQPGSRVLVPFGPRHLIGLIVDRRESGADPKLKSVIAVLDSRPLLNDKLLSLGRWIAWYYVAPLGEVFRIMLPPGLLVKRASPDMHPERYWPAKKQRAVVWLASEVQADITRKQRDVLALLRQQCLPVLVTHLVRERICSEALLRRLSEKTLLRIGLIDLYRSPWSSVKAAPVIRHRLSAEQDHVLAEIRKSLREGVFASILLHGVTASGKTEIYLNAIHDVVNGGGSALILVPEIGLTPQVSSLFRSWFHDRVAILHSALSGGERFDQWRRIRSGEASVVVGTRSAAFAPLPNLRMIVIDEEHDTSYKQSDRPRYNGRDVALKRGQLEEALVVLGSATPQLETYHNAISRESPKYLPMKARVLDRPLPAVRIVDMREEFQRKGKGVILSDVLVEGIEDRLNKGEQVLILLNRRGYAPWVLCRSCGYVETCENCSISLTFHQEKQRLICHYCGYSVRVPSSCNECGKEYVHFLGEGTEKIQQLVSERFPRNKVDRLDRDTTRRRGSYERILGAFRRGKTEILIGTQMIAKGHDFPAVTLVGVLGADQGLRIPDFRAAERTFQLLTQVAGRAGRGKRPGEVIIQTYYPNHYSLRCARTQDFLQFSKKELKFRRDFRYPPYTAVANLVIQDSRNRSAQSLARDLVDRLKKHRDEVSSANRLRIMGPAPASIERLKRDYRYQIILRTTDRKRMHKVLQLTLDELVEEKVSLSRVLIDIDPVSLL